MKVAQFPTLRSIRTVTQSQPNPQLVREFDKSKWSITPVGAYGFEKLRVNEIRLDPTGVQIDFEIHTRGYMEHLDVSKAGVRTLKYQWQHNKASFLTNRQYLLTVLNLVYLSFSSLGNLAKRFEIDFSTGSGPALLQAANESPAEFGKIRALYYDILQVERNNMRHVMGLTSQGYIQPTNSTMGGLGSLVGDFHKPIAESDHGVDTSVIEGEFPWADYPITRDSKCIVNMSFGKESLMTFYALRNLVQMPAENIPLTIFGHTDFGFQSTYLDMAKEFPYNEHPLQVILTNYLDKVLVPACDIKIGGPINMLTHIYEMLNQLAYFGEGVTHMLCGDEYDRSLPANIQFSRKAARPEKVYSYDYEQSPDFAAKLNWFQKDTGGFIRGSLLYGITGYQAQMLLDRVLDPQAKQTSCHSIHEFGGDNCGQCQKCIRVGTIKSIMGEVEKTLNYKPTFAQVEDILKWSVDEFFISYMPVDAPFLHRQYAAMSHLIKVNLEASKAKAEGQAYALGMNRFDDATSALGEHAFNEPGRPNLLSPELFVKFEQALMEAAGSLRVSDESFVQSFDFPKPNATFKPYNEETHGKPSSPAAV